MWVRWGSAADFEVWHETVKAVLGIPHPNVNVASGLVDEDAEWTTEYVCPYWVDGLPVAWVPADCPRVEPVPVPCDPPPAEPIS